jgi:hypothetical protein
MGYDALSRRPLLKFSLIAGGELMLSLRCSMVTPILSNVVSCRKKSVS